MADLEAGATGTMTSALACEKIRPIVFDYLNGHLDKAEDQYQRLLPLINLENRQCGLRACKVIMKQGGVIKSDAVRHPLEPLPELARKKLLKLSKDLDLIALRWGK